MRIAHVTPILVKKYLNDKTRRRTVFLRGPSGIGKSDVVFQTSDLLAEHVANWKGVIDLRLAQMEPTDLRGIPHVVDGRTHWARPDFLPQEGAGICSSTRSPLPLRLCRLLRISCALPLKTSASRPSGWSSLLAIARLTVASRTTSLHHCRTA